MKYSLKFNLGPIYLDLSLLMCYLDGLCIGENKKKTPNIVMQ